MNDTPLVDGRAAKSLYLGFNRSYTNATAELTLRTLGAITVLDYFGPGFSSDTELAQGLSAWCEKHGPYDFVIVDSYVFEHENLLKRAKPFIGDHIRFRPEDFAKYGGAYQEFFLNHVGKKIFIANWDTFGITTAMIERLVKSGTYVIESGISFHRPKQEIARLYGQPFQLGNDSWYDFVNQYKERVISIPHFLASTEFDFSPLGNRKEIFAVIGAPYAERKQAMLVQTKRQRVFDFLVRLRMWIRAKFIDGMTEKQLTDLKANYLSSISSTKLCYCSGGPWLCPVRKYFEIPARGAVAIGWACSGFADLGFVDKYNFLVATTNEVLEQLICSHSDEQLQSIASRGRSLMWNVHSDWARAKQMTQSLELLLKNEFKGSYWRDGQYRHYV